MIGILRFVIVVSAVLGIEVLRGLIRVDQRSSGAILHDRLLDIVSVLHGNHVAVFQMVGIIVSKGAVERRVGEKLLHGSLSLLFGQCPANRFIAIKELAKGGTALVGGPSPRGKRVKGNLVVSARSKIQVARTRKRL